MTSNTVRRDKGQVSFNNTFTYGSGKISKGANLTTPTYVLEINILFTFIHLIFYSINAYLLQDRFQHTWRTDPREVSRFKGYNVGSQRWVFWRQDIFWALHNILLPSRTTTTVLHLAALSTKCVNFNHFRWLFENFGTKFLFLAIFLSFLVW